MDDDFNTPDAMAVMQGVARDLNRAKAAGETARRRPPRARLRRWAKILGVFNRIPETYLKRGVAPDRVVRRGRREHCSRRGAAPVAKKARNPTAFATRSGNAGVVLEDKPGGETEWRRAYQARDASRADRKTSHSTIPRARPTTQRSQPLQGLSRTYVGAFEHLSRLTINGGAPSATALLAAASAIFTFARTRAISGVVHVFKGRVRSSTLSRKSLSWTVSHSSDLTHRGVTIPSFHSGSSSEWSDLMKPIKPGGPGSSGS